MIPTYKVNAADMLRWAEYLEDLSPATNQAVAQGLNNYGEIVARQTAEQFAETADLQASEVYNQIVIRRATPNNLTWRMDASALKLPDGDVARPMEDNRDTNQYRDQELVNIVTSGHDPTVEGPCEICDEAAAAGPYTMAEIDVIAAKWKDFVPVRPVSGVRTNLLHPNCRCIVTPYANKRRLRVQFGDKEAKPELYTAKQLGAAVAGELKIAIKAVRKKK